MPDSAFGLCKYMVIKHSLSTSRQFSEQHYWQILLLVYWLALFACQKIKQKLCSGLQRDTCCFFIANKNIVKPKIIPQISELGHLLDLNWIQWRKKCKSSPSRDRRGISLPFEFPDTSDESREAAALRIRHVSPAGFAFACIEPTSVRGLFLCHHLLTVHHILHLMEPVG